MNDRSPRILQSATFLFVLIMMGIGLVQVYSASFVYSTEVLGSGLFFFQRQLVNLAAALVVLMIAARVPLNWLAKWGWAPWLIATVLMILCFVPGLGIRAGGAARWLRLPLGFRFEPSEFAKVSFCIFLASIMAFRAERGALFRSKWFLLTLVASVVVPLLILLKQPDFGSFALIFCVASIALFVNGMKWRWVLATAVSGTIAFYILIMQVPYRRARLISFLDPWSDPEQKGFQVIQSMLSFSSGDFFGVGLGQGQGKLFFLPEAHTDFTLAVFGEENGFLGFSLLMVLYALLIHRGLKASAGASTVFTRVLALALTSTFALNVFVNMGVALGLLPTKGLTLPFLSYGGSSLLMLGMLFGLLINIELRATGTPAAATPAKPSTPRKTGKVAATVARI